MAARLTASLICAMDGGQGGGVEEGARWVEGIGELREISVCIKADTIKTCCKAYPLGTECCENFSCLVGISARCLVEFSAQTCVWIAGGKVADDVM